VARVTDRCVFLASVEGYVSDSAKPITRSGKKGADRRALLNVRVESEKMNIREVFE